MPIDYSDPKVLKFVTETYVKANNKRVAWFLKNTEKLQATATYGPNYKGYHTEDVMRAPMAECLPSLTQQFKVSAVNRRKKPLRDGFTVGLAGLRTTYTIPDVGLDDDKTDPNLQRSKENLSIEPIMRPVEDKSKAVLREVGRHPYLRTRKRKIPEDKYYFPECSSYVYGWRLKDTGLDRKGPKYGRYWSVKRDTSNRSGPQPNPPHYQSPPDAYSKC